MVQRKSQLAKLGAGALVVVMTCFLVVASGVWKQTDGGQEMAQEIVRLGDRETFTESRNTSRGQVRTDIDPKQPCKHARFVFVHATGRSGSTTLRGFLNSIPGYWISGENWGASIGLMGFFKRLKTIPQNMIHGKGVFENHFDYAVIRNNIRKTIIDVISPTWGDEVIGYKEVKNTDPELFQFLKGMFPCMKLILNYRLDVEEQAKTPMHRQSHHTAEGLAKKNQQMIDFHAKHPQWTYLMPLQDFNAAKFDALLAWLGESHCRTGSIPHSHQKDSYVSDSRSWNSTVCM
eukprot:jgi/Pico_ML_1/55610/g1275.t1